MFQCSVKSRIFLIKLSNWQIFFYYWIYYYVFSFFLSKTHCGGSWVIFLILFVILTIATILRTDYFWIFFFTRLVFLLWFFFLFFFEKNFFAFFFGAGGKVKVYAFLFCARVRMLLVVQYVRVQKKKTILLFFLSNSIIIEHTYRVVKRNTATCVLHCLSNCQTHSVIAQLFLSFVFLQYM